MSEEELVAAQMSSLRRAAVDTVNAWDNTKRLSEAMGGEVMPTIPPLERLRCEIVAFDRLIFPDGVPGGLITVRSPGGQGRE